MPALPSARDSLSDPQARKPHDLKMPPSLSGSQDPSEPPPFIPSDAAESSSANRYLMLPVLFVVTSGVLLLGGLIGIDLWRGKAATRWKPTMAPLNAGPAATPPDWARLYMDNNPFVPRGRLEAYLKNPPLPQVALTSEELAVALEFFDRTRLRIDLNGKVDGLILADSFQFVIGGTTPETQDKLFANDGVTVGWTWLADGAFVRSQTISLDIGAECVEWDPASGCATLWLRPPWNSDRFLSQQAESFDLAWGLWFTGWFDSSELGPFRGTVSFSP